MERVRVLLRYQWQLYALLMTLSAITICARLIVFSPLYLDQSLRAQMIKAIHEAAEERGWLLSGVELHRVRGDAMQITYHSHVRGSDPEECFIIDSLTYDTSSCTSAL